MNVVGPRPAPQDYGDNFVATTNVTDILSIQNNTGNKLLIVERNIYVELGDAGVSVDVGIAADAATNGDNLIDGQAIATDNAFVTANGTNGAVNRIWNPGEWVNMKKAGGTISGIKGKLVLVCTPYVPA